MGGAGEAEKLAHSSGRDWIEGDKMGPISRGPHSLIGPLCLLGDRVTEQRQW